VNPPAVPTPRQNPELFGHAAAERRLLDAWASGRLPHAWLICGPRGIGKATLAYRFARFLLKAGDATGGSGRPASLASDPQDPVFRRVAAGGHADLLTVERGWDKKRERRRGEIIVDDVRDVGAFLRLTPAEGGWRVVVVDSADEMNPNAANAILKVLEEPPRRAALLLVSHAPGRLLPTIRSRCCRLVLKPLAEDAVARLVRR
jgi:DNA polymerase-3 subunit delta'